MIDQINALNRFALCQKRNWRTTLEQCWARAAYPADTSVEDKALLSALYANDGLAKLKKFRPREGGYTTVCHLKPAKLEIARLRRSRFVKAWRITTPCGIDFTQPWCQSMSEARSVADELGVYIAKVEQ